MPKRREKSPNIISIKSIEGEDGSDRDSFDNSFDNSEITDINEWLKNNNVTDILPKAAEGNFVVNENCINCDVCRWMCPKSFAKSGVGTIVSQQPNTTVNSLIIICFISNIPLQDEIGRALAAMISCPVGAIRTINEELMTESVRSSFPIEVFYGVIEYLLNDI